MLEIAHHLFPPDTACFSDPGIEETQSLAPDRSTRAPAREGRGRFAKGSSGNPRGRPPGIPNPTRRMPVRPLHGEALFAFIDRKPHLLRSFTGRLLKPARPPDPADIIGLDLTKIRTPDDARAAIDKIFAATARGIIAPREALRLSRRVRTRMRQLRRAARSQRRLLRLACGAKTTPPARTGVAADAATLPPPDAPSPTLAPPAEIGDGFPFPC